ncbi:MAG: class I SAM-dependent methyltransferase [Desulfotalea sp.]
MIYNDYDDEPEDLFSPLTDAKYTELYDKEMEGFEEDFPFYCKYINKKDSILEVGCGTGRISSKLNCAGYNITGLDYSPTMLKKANQRNPNLPIVQADITTTKLKDKYDKILAPYNFLNLFHGRNIGKVLQNLLAHLNPKGKILCELNCLEPESTLIKAGASFQFQIIDGDFGRIIKEIKREYNSSDKKINIEERYRVRPKQGENQDYNHRFSINAHSFIAWERMFTEHNFKIYTFYNDYLLNQNQVQNRLLVVLEIGDIK